MSIKKFKFVSPGIFINEIDQSHLPKLPARMGPVVMGRSVKGPGFRPTIIHSYSEFVEIFGEPDSGGKYDDVWRNGNLTAPTYAAYAAQAYLQNNNPVTFVRVLGDDHSQNDGTSGATAGWQTTTAVGSGGGSYGLFVINSASLGIPPSGTILMTSGGFGSTAIITIDATNAGGQMVTLTSSITLSASYSAGDLSGGFCVAAGNDKDLTAVLPAGDVLNARQLYEVINLSKDDHLLTASLWSPGTAEYDKTIYPDATVLLTARRDLKSIVDFWGVSGSWTITVDAADTDELAFTASAGRSASLGGTAPPNIADNGSNTGFVTGAADEQAQQSGTLAAVWYFNTGSIELVGGMRGETNLVTSGTAVLLGNTGNKEWKVRIIGEGSTRPTTVETAFSFKPSSDNYIRKVFNTNPTLTNSNIFSDNTHYWLGETFERAVEDSISNSDSNSAWGVILGLASGSQEYSKQLKSHLPSETGWIISQDVGVDTASFDAANVERAKKLFKLVSLEDGQWVQSNIKVSIENIKPARSDKNWPMFTVTLRKMRDDDLRPAFIEKFLDCNLNPNSPNYIARKIGDKRTSYDAVLKRLITIGNYDNKSRFVRVETNESVYSRELLPFGAYGPPRYKSFVISGTGHLQDDATGENGAWAGPSGSIQSGSWAADGGGPFVQAGSDIEGHTTHFSASFNSLPAEVHVGSNEAGKHATFTGSFFFPAAPLRENGTNGNIVDQRKAYWGVDVTQKGDTVLFDQSTVDIIKTKPHQTSESTLDFSSEDHAERSWFFTLDDIVLTGSAQEFTYVSGSREGGTSVTALSGSSFLLTSSGFEINKFTTVFYGGFDGFDITEREAFNAERALPSTATEKNSYAFFSQTKALEIVKDSEVVECNIMTMPGIINKNLTGRLVDICEERRDALAIIDIEHDYTPDTDNTDDEKDRRGDVDNAIAALKDRNIDSSYGCCYYPWVQIRDTAENAIVWVPPSIVALGAMGYSEAVKDVWFAPAGFNRGGLTATQAGGLPVVGINQQLVSKQRDKLYEVGINPIASFPAEGIVIFGQKTLQVTPSALDRINVRRLLIFLKKEISRIASVTLFEQNVHETWATFRSSANDLLKSVQVRFGLADYKLVLDETTTTPELIDRNILYAKVFLKPARAIEFIALDFIITRSGASFED